MADRRDFIKAVGLTAALGSMSTGVSVMSATTQPKSIKALAFDAYGTLFDVFSVTSLCETLFPGNGNALAQSWRAKQLQYSLLRSMMDRYKDFWQVTADGLIYSAKSLKLDLTDDKRKQLMDAYLTLAPFPDVKPGLEALRKRGLRLAILSNGEPVMLKAAADSAGIEQLLDTIVSANELKVFKPSPRVYHLIGQRLNLATNRIGFVSSNSWDINGAGAAGLQTFWIQRNAGEPQEELGFPAQHIVRAITELDGIIGQR
jgi:2-haloacid dehalogenase